MELDRVLRRCLITEDRGEEVNIVDALFAIAGAIQDLAASVNRLGLNDAATPMGAVEMLAEEVKGLAAAVTNGLDYLADRPGGPGQL
jgi:hypothetical protein